MGRASATSTTQTESIARTDRLLTLEQVKQRLQVSHETVYRLMRQGKLKLVAQLLPHDWWYRFGADGYRALTEFPGAATTRIIDAIHSRLGDREVWPTCAERGKATKKRTFSKANEVVVADETVFEGFLSPARYLASQLREHSEVASLAIKSGARRFGLASVVRLRCAGEDATVLNTKLNGEASFYFSDFPDSWRDIALQRRFGEALDSHRAQRRAE